MKTLIIFLLMWGLFITGVLFSAPNPDLEKITLPPGFTIEIYYHPVPGARSLAMGESGTIFVGTRGNKVYAITDTNDDKKGDSLFTIASGLNTPNGVAFYKKSLYVAEISSILRFDTIEKKLNDPPKPVIIYNSFPKDRHHGWKFIAFGPDNKLYVPIGAPCNVCEKTNPLYSSIHRINPDGSGLEIVAAGVRNSVGFDWHPDTRELWFTDNGRDMLGDDIPPDELNRVYKQGLHFGFPYIHGKDIKDPVFKPGKDLTNFTPPEIELGPHVASLGMRFYTGSMFPAKYKGQIFIAEHGSWNRSVPIGYRITLVTIKNNKAISYSVFAHGWLEDGRSWGRPVDVLELKDGSLLVSDDKADAIYRIYYKDGR